MAWLSWALTGEHLVQFAATLVQSGWENVPALVR
jgi:hypothetical protein